METSSAEMGSSATIKAGTGGQRPGDTDALPLPARKLVRVATGKVRVEADQFHEFGHTFRTFLFVADVMDVQPFADDAADGIARVQ